MLKSPDIARFGPVAPKRLTQAFVAVAVLVFAVGVGVLFLLQTHIQTLQKSARDKEAQVGSNEQVAQRYQTTLEEYNQTLSHIQFLEASVSQKSYVPTLLQQLQRLAQTNHLTVTAVRPAPAAPPPPVAPGEASKKKAVVLPYDMLDIGVDVTGTYPDTATLLYNLTRFPKIISVASAQMRPASVPGRSPLAAPVVSTNLHLTAFVFREDPAAGTTGKAGPAAGIAASPAGGAATGIAGGALGGTAAHAVGGALGAERAARERAQVGVSSL